MALGLIAVAISLGLLAGGAPDAHAQSLQPSFDWSMPARLADHDGDGFIDSSILPSVPSPTCNPTTPMLGNVNPCHPEARNFVSAVDGFTLNLDGCASEGAIIGYRWQVAGVVVGESADCTFSLTFPREGVYDITLELLPASGADPVSLTQAVPVQDWLIIAFGDSYGSGEGAPDLPSVWGELAEGISIAWTDFTAYLSGVATDCLSLASLPGETLIALGEAVIDLDLAAFGSAIVEFFEEGNELVEACGKGVIGIPEEAAKLIAGIIDPLSDAGKRILEPLRSGDPRRDRGSYRGGRHGRRSRSRVHERADGNAGANLRAIPGGLAG